MDTTPIISVTSMTEEQARAQGYNPNPRFSGTSPEMIIVDEAHLIEPILGYDEGVCWGGNYILKADGTVETDRHRLQDDSLSLAKLDDALRHIPQTQMSFIMPKENYDRLRDMLFMPRDLGPAPIRPEHVKGHYQQHQRGFTKRHRSMRR